MIGARYAWPVALLLAAAAGPVLLHVHAAPEPSAPGALAAELAAAAPALARADEGPRRPSFAERHFDSRDFVSRTVAVSAEAELEFFAVRTLDWKTLFHFPEIALARGHACTDRRTIEAGGGAPVPAVRLEFRTSTSVRIAAYTLLHDGRAVAHPISYLLKVLPRMLFRTRRPMTLVYVQGDATEETAGARGREVEALLLDAVRALGAECE